MAYETDPSTNLRAREFFHGKMGRHLSRRELRESFATYAFGLLGEGERKSVEPIAARAFSDPVNVERCQARLLHFLRDSPWSDRDVRRTAALHAIEAMQESAPVDLIIFDDTGFLKQGKDSVGVQRQYTGSAGKVENCQIGVSLVVSNGKEHLPIDFELYLPAQWLDDPKRRKSTRIPEGLAFKTKPELALDMLARAMADGIPGKIVLADSAYGDSSAFRDAVFAYGLDYAVGIKSPTRVWLLDQHGEPERIVSAKDLAKELGREAFRLVTWRTGTKGKLSSRFYFRRVKPVRGAGELEEKEALWLGMEWPEGESEPTKYFLTTLPRHTTKKKIIRILKERWRTEKVYEELKEELGLDHFEGRSFPGWHHHVSVVLCCYAFVIVERMRHFPPSAGRQA